ncbi:hypothetical protein GUY44_22340 [Pimelobacter simplex]|uniref:Uncharacterized protein n=1 Tax=Nocardioides simplex TaxID=2045 RepID=A0A0A1DML4_NOCSI|nr:hypothetical protein [Pimelobacter simplex]AIY18584.1 hypothetical protein KR76_20745 [Pimelobacter simplex]MCG8153238.1 hypothetical protein [Pimelobacter simplex]GEB14224.1 hypothetical protein NSI01_25390 [Pimelobacter simplex]SFM32197.1 hypothetical protein SAMN05421671_1195 [Pimelobacter simplex]
MSPDPARRFATGVAGALVVSVVWLGVTAATTTTPGEARERRAAPRLPVPVAALRVVDFPARGGAPAGPALAAPAGAVETAGDGTSRVEVVDGDRRRAVPVTIGRTADGLVEVAGAGLGEGDAVRLHAAPVRGGGP